MFVAWLNDPEVRQFLLIRLPLSLAQEEQWFENMLKCPPAEHVLVIEVNTGSGWKAIGNTSFMDIDWTNRFGEVGIFIGDKEFWNKGYGRETMRLMLKHGFETLNLNRVWLKVYEYNPRGIRSYEKAGFRHEGRYRQAKYHDGQYYDILIMSVLHQEWLEHAQEAG
jgi:RimJ/RimL family protein N-acetyltransferase